MTTTESVSAEPIQLDVPKNAQGEVDSLAPVQWCLSKQVRGELVQYNAKDPQMLIVVEKDGREMDRFLAPVKQGMIFIPYRTPGENVVHATVVWGKDPAPRRAVFRRTDEGDYALDVLETRRPTVEKIERRIEQLEAMIYGFYRYDPTLDDARRTGYEMQIGLLNSLLDKFKKTEQEQTTIREFDSLRRISVEGQVGVVVPEQNFGQPWTLTKRLGTFYKRWPGNKAKDQCSLRRRAVLTAFSLPFYAVVMGLFYLAKGFVMAGAFILNASIAGLLLFLGMRNINFAPLRHPLGMWPSEVWSNVKPSVWWFRRVEDEVDYGTDANPHIVVVTSYKVREYIILRFINPPVLTLVGLAVGLPYVFGVGAAGSATINWHTVLRYGLYAIGVAAGTMFVFYVLRRLVRVGLRRTRPQLETKLAKRAEARQMIKQERKTQEAQRKNKQTAERWQAEIRARELSRQKLAEELAVVGCDTRTWSASQPPSLSTAPRRTIRLVAQAGKAKVCKPLAR